MSWKNRLLPASFRGVAFCVADTDVLFGRRNQLHEYPLRDEPYAEDLGKKAQEYTFNAYVIGDDYLAARDALIKAIEDHKTPGTLIHPTLGTKTVIPKECRVVFSNQEGGLERFVLTFVEAGTNKFPSSVANTDSLLNLASDNALNSFLTSFTSVFNIKGFQDFVANAAQTLSGNFVNTLLNLLNVGATSKENYSTFKSSLSNFSGSTGSSVTNPQQFGSRISGLITQLSSVYASPADAYTAQKNLQSFGNDVLPINNATTPATQQQAVNQTAFIDLVKNSSAVELARLTTAMDFPSKQDAIKIRDEVGDILDTRMLNAANASNDVQYHALSDVRNAMIQHVNAKAITLPNLTTVKTHDSVPAVVFAYQQYADASRDSEIIARNHIMHPLFLPPHSELEILA